MSGLEELLGLCGICFCCCLCFEGVQNNNHWCYMRCCSGERYRVRGRSGGCCSCKRTMNDDDFERTIEELYGPGKDVPVGQSTHVVELQPTRARATTTTTTQQPAARPSMEARAPLEGDTEEEERERERVMLAGRKGAKDRTRQWVAAQTGSGVAAAVEGDGDGQHDGGRGHRSESQVPPRPESVSRAHRPQQLSESYAPQQGRSQARRPSDSRSESHQQQPDGGRELSPPLDGVSGDVDGPRQPPRLDIPTSLMPGRAQGSVPAQLPFDLGSSPHSPSTQLQAAVPSRAAPEQDITETREVVA